MLVHLKHHNSCFNFGGGQSNSQAQLQTESWNGSSWTEVGDLNTAS